VQHACASTDPARSFTYERRRPEEGVLYKTLQRHLSGFVADIEARGEDRKLPRFVRQELFGYLGCGILQRGFVRVRCTSCGHDRVVAFSCKGRGFCPSCGGRRMADTAAHLVDRVIPEVPVRQWVLSLPRPIRYLLGYDKQALSRVIRTFTRAISGWQKRRAKKLGIADPQTGGITFIQRFSSSLALNVHLHSLLFDGVYTIGENGELRFIPLPPPTDEEMAKLCATIAKRITRTLRRTGKLPDETDPEPDELAANDPTLAACYGASVANRVATGERAGRRVERIGDRVDVEDLQTASDRCASSQGFSLHANVAVPARDRGRLERLCRYVARPPIATERLEELPDGRIAYSFRKPWRDGTRAVVFTPHELIEKLVALVPPPQTNMVRYHGVLAPASKLRKRVVRDGRARGEAKVEEKGGGPKPKRAEREVPVGVAGRIGLDEDLRPRRMSWAELMKRVFSLDVLECPECKGRMKVIATITDPEVVRKFLASIDLPTQLPPMERARPPPQVELEFGDPEWDDEFHLP
jgi:hypothetical protein